MVIHEFGRPGVDSLKDLDVDATVAALDPHVPGGPAATSDSFFELPAGRDVLPPAGAAGAAPTLPPHGLQDVEIRMNPDPTRIQYHENMEFAGVWHARIAEHGGIAVDGPRGATLGGAWYAAHRRQCAAGRPSGRHDLAGPSAKPSFAPCRGALARRSAPALAQSEPRAGCQCARRSLPIQPDSAGQHRKWQVFVAGQPMGAPEQP
jgi:hypothetical protein